MLQQNEGRLPSGAATDSYIHKKSSMSSRSADVDTCLEASRKNERPAVCRLQAGRAVRCLQTRATFDEVLVFNNGKREHVAQGDRAFEVVPVHKVCLHMVFR